MASEIGIINSALRKLGASRITGRNDGSRNANLADDLYDDVRDRMLRSGKWNFAKTRAQLSRSLDTPDSGFNYIYVKPTDWLKNIAVYDNDAAVGSVSFNIEAEGYHSSAEELYIAYIKEVSDPNQMTADFREALAFELSKQFSTTIKAGKGLRDRLEKDGDIAVSEAKSADATEDQPEQQPEGSWVEDRAR